MSLSQRADRIGRAGSRLTEELLGQFRHEGGTPVRVTAHPARPLPTHVSDEIAASLVRNQMAPSAGDTELRDAIAADLAIEFARPVSRDEILITAGAMHALHIAFMGLLDPGDAVVTTSPCFFFDGIARLSNANMVYHETRPEDGYAWRLSDLKTPVPRARILLLNSPTNPTGYVCSHQDLVEAAALAEANNWYIVSDESYDRFVYDGSRHLSPALLAGSANRTIVIRSFTKSFAMPAWRVGYIYAPKDVIKAFTRILEWSNLYCNHIAQRAALAAFLGSKSWLAELTSELESNRDTIWQTLGQDPTFRFTRPNGGPFILVSIPSLTERLTDDEIAEQLARRFGIPATSGTVFHAPKRLRIPFGGEPSEAATLASRLIEAVGKLVEEVTFRS